MKWPIAKSDIYIGWPGNRKRFGVDVFGPGSPHFAIRHAEARHVWSSLPPARVAQRPDPQCIVARSAADARNIAILWRRRYSCGLCPSLTCSCRTASCWYAEPPRRSNAPCHTPTLILCPRVRGVIPPLPLTSSLSAV
jgi:hypothetical protein